MSHSNIEYSHLFLCLPLFYLTIPFRKVSVAFSDKAKDYLVELKVELVNLLSVFKRWMDDLRFYVLLTVFQSYQDGVWTLMKGCVQWNSV